MILNHPFKLHVLKEAGLFLAAWLLVLSSTFAATYTVNGTGDAGTGAGTTGDLRYCITQANAIAGPHTINFSVAGTITLTANLPVFTRQITLAGNTAPGYAVTAPVILINANNVAGWGFLFNAAGGAGSVIRGIVVHRAQNTNIEINNVNNITVQDCFIGLNMLGTASSGGNPTFGILMVTSSNNTITGNTISGHATHGVLINVNSLNNTLRGNKIGTNAAGTAAVPNAVHGIEINNTSTGTIIGGAAVADRNIVSGNVDIGISIVGGSGTVQIINNYIGINAAGTAAIPNGEHGILMNGSASGTITNNVVSGNGIFGILLINGNNHIIRSNKVGTNAAGTAAIANANAGLSIVDGDFAIVGGTAAGEGNTLSGNGDVGLRLESSVNVTVQGNFIGTNSTGNGAVGNNSSGIFGINGCNNVQIGGNVAGARNIISCNRIHGMQFMISCNDLVIENNYIGTDVTGNGTAAFGNGEIGIILNDNCLRPRIGGTTTAQRNVISGNGRLWDSVTFTNNGTGIQMIAGVTNSVITGNYIGLAADGITARGNAENGIVILGGCDGYIIGGNTAAMRNVVSSNGRQGVVINGSSNGDIIGNYFGTDAAGTLARGNGQSGLILIFSSNNEVGRATVAERNIMSNNFELGIHVVGGNANIIYGNYIGVAADGTTAMGNRNGGVYIVGVAGGTNGSDVIVGGLGANQPNIIAYSTGTGVNPVLGNGFGIAVAHNDQGLRNRFIGNKIFCNAGLGIDLNFGGSFDGGLAPGNGGKTAPTLTSLSATTTTGTGTPGDVIHVYSNVTCTTCQGENYLGTATVTAGGTWSVTHVAVAVPAFNSATATNTSQGTSQFTCNIALPVELIDFQAVAQNGKVLLTWETAWEKNNLKFEIERSIDGIHFASIGSVKGKGTITTLSDYTFTDAQPLTGVSYYRLKQVDLDGQFQYSVIRVIEIEQTTGITVYPNPSENETTIEVHGSACEVYQLKIYNEIGQELYSEENMISGRIISMEGFTPGVYYVQVRCSEEIFIEKVFKK